MYVLDPLFNIKTADKELDDLHSMASELFSRLENKKKKEDAKAKSKADPELANKVKEGLKGKKYKDDKTGVEVSFGTAYARGHAQAKADFNKEMANAKQEKKEKGLPSGAGADDSKSIAKKINQLDTKKDLNPQAVKILKALRGRDPEKAKQTLEEIESGAERGVVDALIQIMASPELQQVLGGVSLQPTVDLNDAQPKPSSKNKQPPVIKQPAQSTPSNNKQPSKPSTQSTPSTQPTPAKPSATPTPKPTQPKSKPTQPKPTQPKPTQPKPTQPKETPPPIVESGMSAKPKLDMARVNKWIKEKKEEGFKAGSFEKHLKTLDIDMDDKELDAFMSAYTETTTKKLTHDDYKKYKDVDLSTIKNPKELAKAMAIKKEAEFHFNPLSGLALDDLSNIKDMEKEKEYVRMKEQKRYSKMPPEDRKAMGDKLQAEISKLDPVRDKDKIAIMESAYDGLLASALFENNQEEMQELFNIDPTEKMNDEEKKEYLENKEQKRKQRISKFENKIKDLEGIKIPLSSADKVKRSENTKKIDGLKTKTKEIGGRLKQIQSELKKQDIDEKVIAELQAELKAKEEENKEIKKQVSDLEKENDTFDLRDVKGALKAVKDYEQVKAELDALKEKLLQSQNDPNVDTKELKADQIAYKKLMDKKDKAQKAQAILKQRKQMNGELKTLYSDSFKEKLVDMIPASQKEIANYEQQIKQTESEIAQLKSKTDKTPEEENDLAKKEKQLANDKRQLQNEKNGLVNLQKQFEKNQAEQEKKKPKRYPLNQDIVALVQTMNNPKTLNALMQMTRVKNQGEYKENLKTIFRSVSDEDLMAVVEKTPVSEMAKLLSPSYCPQDVSNKSTKGYDDDSSSSSCKVTLSHAQKQEAREHIIDFISNEMFFTNADKGKTKEVSVNEDEEEKTFEDDSSEREKQKQEEKAKEEEQARAKEQEEKEKVKKHQEEIKKYTKNFEDALLIHDEKKRVERIKQITTDLNLAKASQATRDERSKAMIDAIRKIPNPKKRQEYLELLQNNDSDPPIFKKTRLGTDKNFNKVFINNNNNNKGLDFNMKKKSTTITNYQEIANTFRIGMKVFPFYGGSKDHHGTVVAIYPAIGMVDVQFPFGSSRYPVEDLQIADMDIDPVQYDSIPGGLGTKPVNAKTALYWADKDRKYRMTREELKPTCPRCKGIELKKTIYKRIGGKSERLLCCPECLFLIKTTDILGFN